MIQLIEPNLTVKGRVGFCLEYAAHVFGYYGSGTNAWDAWEQTKHKHTDAIPTDVAVPVWFSYWATIAGVYANYGHVVISVPGQGFYSSPYQLGTDHAVLSSIAEIERIYGVEYVGWSEDILGLQVIQGGDMPLTSGQIDKLIKMGLNREPTAEELGNQDYANNPGLAIDTFWNNGGKDTYEHPVTPGYEPVTETLYRKKV